MALEVRNLAKKYEGFSLSLSLKVEDGETLILAGPSGCGKTTALSLIAGLEKPDSGSIDIDGRSMDSLPPHKRNIAMVFQDLALFPHLTAGANVGYGPFIRGVKKPERLRLIEEKLQIVRLEGYQQRRIGTLSGGELQRVAIARALAQDPLALLLDEPFSSLDAPLRRELRQSFLEIRGFSSAPWVFVTHDREEAAVLGDRIALLSNGKILEEGPVQELFLYPKTEFAARFFAFGTILGAEILRVERGLATAQSAFGAMTVPIEAGQTSGRIFIPRDGLSLRTQGEKKAEGCKEFSLPFAGAAWEGDRVFWKLTLPSGWPGDTALRIEGRLRSHVPRMGEPVAFTVNEKMLRFVKTTDAMPDACGLAAAL